MNHLETSNFYGEDLLIPLILEEHIKMRILAMGEEISKDYKDKCPLIIGVLNGAFVFMADLIRALSIECEVDFIRLSSYGSETISSGEIKVLKDINVDVAGRDVIVVEDIVDTGLTLNFLRNKIQSMKPASIKFASFALTDETKTMDQLVDYVGFHIHNEFVVGYGLDFDQKMRGLDSVYVLKEKNNDAQ